MRFIITSGASHDSTQAIPLMRHIIKEGMRVLGDRAYDSAKILVYIAYHKALSVIPPRKNKAYKQRYNKLTYKNRNQVERFFQRLKNFRRVATRYDKLPSSFLSFVYLAATIISLPKLPNFVLVYPVAFNQGCFNQ